MNKFITLGLGESTCCLQIQTPKADSTQSAEWGQRTSTILKQKRYFRVCVCVCVCVCNNKYCDENNGAGTNNWIRVKNSHSDNIRRKNTQQLNNLITLSNRFAVVDNLYISPYNATTIPKLHKALRAQIYQKRVRNILFC